MENVVGQIENNQETEVLSQEGLIRKRGRPKASVAKQADENINVSNQKTKDTSKEAIMGETNTNKKSKQKLYDLEQIEQIRNTLLNLPPVPRKCYKKQAIQMLAKEIKDILSRGYTLQEIVQVLKEKDFEITPNTLKEYLKETRANQAKARSVNKKKTSTSIKDSN